MKPLESAVEITTEGLDNAESIAMRLDENGLAHIMSVLTNLYSDPMLAVIREYSTNAYDAQVDAGVTRPIEVTTPTASGGFLSSTTPTFTVRDHGIGMSVDDIRDLYSAYGASTKRESNLVNGMLGLGSKSALTYADAFTVTAVKNGVRTIVSVHRDARGGGTMTVLDTCATDEGNGVTITVPVKQSDITRFEETVNNFYYYWKPGTVLVNGSEPESMWTAESLTDLGDGHYIAPAQNKDKWGYARNSIVLLMGNVAYPVRSEDSDHAYALLSNPLIAGDVVVDAPIGSFRFVPSREAPNFDVKTREFVEATAKAVTTKVADKINSLVSSATDVLEVFDKMNTYFKSASLAEGASGFVMWGNTSVSNYKDAEIHQDIACYEIRQDKMFFEYSYTSGATDVGGRGYSRRRFIRKPNVSDFNSFSNRLPRLTIINAPTGANGRITSGARAMLKNYLDENGLTGRHRRFFVISGEYVSYTPIGETDTYVLPTEVVDWNDIIKARRAARSAGLIKSVSVIKEIPEYTIATSAGTFEGHVDESLKTIITDSKETRLLAEILDEAYGKNKWQVVVVPSTRKAKFDRLYPNLKTVTYAGAKDLAVANYLARVGKDKIVLGLAQKKTVEYDYNNRKQNMARHLVYALADRKDVTDTEFAELAGVAGAGSKIVTNTHVSGLVVQDSEVRKAADAKAKIIAAKADALAVKYPMLSLIENGLTPANQPAIVDYINKMHSLSN